MSLKKIIITVISNNKNIGLKEISKLVNKESTKKYSYSTIYKNIQKLIDEEIILKNNTNSSYIINSEWIKEKHNFYSKLFNINITNTNIDTNKHEDIIQNNFIKFESAKKFNEFITKIESEHNLVFSKEKKGEIITVQDHCVDYLFNQAKYISYAKKLQENNIEWKIICRGNTPLDKKAKELFSKINVDITLGINISELASMIIYEDVIVEIFYDKSYSKIVKDTFEKTKSFNEFNLVDLHNKLDNTKYSIFVNLYKNKELIKNIKNKIESKIKRNQLARFLD